MSAQHDWWEGKAGAEEEASFSSVSTKSGTNVLAQWISLCC